MRQTSTQLRSSLSSFCEKYNFWSQKVTETCHNKAFDMGMTCLSWYATTKAVPKEQLEVVYVNALCLSRVDVWTEVCFIRVWILVKKQDSRKSWFILMTYMTRSIDFSRVNLHVNNVSNDEVMTHELVKLRSFIWLDCFYWQRVQ